VGPENGVLTYGLYLEGARYVIVCILLITLSYAICHTLLLSFNHINTYIHTYIYRWDKGDKALAESQPKVIKPIYILLYPYMCIKPNYYTHMCIKHVL
jgi:hypothetical protein